MDNTRLQLLELVKAGCFARPVNTTVFAQCDWETVITLAKEQALIGLALSGKEHLPVELGPERRMHLRWAGLATKIQLRNEVMDKMVVKVAQLFEKMGLHPLIMKGQVTAREYPAPGLRQSGDIDVWFPIQEEAERAFKWAEEHYHCRWMPGEKETAFTAKGVTIELHRRIADMMYSPFDKCLQSILKSHVEACSAEEVAASGTVKKASLCLINEKQIVTLPTAINVFYQLIHLEYHLLNEGVGLRQFCDLATFVHNHSKELQPEHQHLNTWLRDCGLDRIAAAIGLVLHRTFELEKSMIPWNLQPDGMAEKDVQAAANMIMNDIWTGGNFGKKKWDFKGKTGFFTQKVKAMPLHWAQYRKYRTLLPHEAWANFLSKFTRAAKGVK